jgi:hypothetical protein
LIQTTWNPYALAPMTSNALEETNTIASLGTRSVWGARA